MNIRKGISQLLSVLAILLFLLISAQAQILAADEPRQRQSDSHKDATPPDDVELLKLRVGQLERLNEQQTRAMTMMEQRLTELEQKVAALSPAKPPTPAKPSNKSSKESSQTQENAPGKVTSARNSRSLLQHEQPLPPNTPRLSIQSADGKMTANFSVIGQLDFRGYETGNHPPDTFLIRRAEVGIDGTIANHFDYKIKADFSDTHATLVRDAYVVIHQSSALHIQAGHFKEPFSQEELSSSANLDFVERSMVNALAPSRSPGVMLFGAIHHGTLEYQVGAFNGKGLLALNNNNTPEEAVRLRLLPFRNKEGSLFKNLAIGGAYAAGRNQNGVSVQGFTESHSFTFFTPEPVNGAVRRANGEVSWRISQAQVRAEYDQVSQERDALGAGNTNLPAVVGKGFMTQMTYLLTGEHKADNGSVIPNHSLFETEPSRHGIGAFELKARFARLQLSDGTAKANHGESLYFGANWYLNRFVKYFFDFGMERFNDPLRSPKRNDRNYFVTLNRIQFAF
jgi:phosphate-selective porin OprO/OprP